MICLHTFLGTMTWSVNATLPQNYHGTTLCIALETPAFQKLHRKWGHVIVRRGPLVPSAKRYSHRRKAPGCIPLRRQDAVEWRRHSTRIDANFGTLLRQARHWVEWTYRTGRAKPEQHASKVCPCACARDETQFLP